MPNAIKVLIAPGRIPLKKMVGSVFWAGLRFGDTALAEELALCGDQEVISLALKELPHGERIRRIHFPGGRVTRKVGGLGDALITSHPMLYREPRTHRWELASAVTLDEENLADADSAVCIYA